MVLQWLAQCFTFLVLGIWIAVAQSSSSIPKQCLWNSHHKTKQKYRQICQNIYCRFFFVCLFGRLIGHLFIGVNVSVNGCWSICALRLAGDYSRVYLAYCPRHSGNSRRISVSGSSLFFWGGSCVVTPEFLYLISRSGTDHTHNTIKTVCMFMCGSISHTNIFLGFEK